MKLDKIYISRSWDGKEFKGDIEFVNELGKVEIRLDDAACQKIIAVCASQLVKTSKSFADDMTSKCIDLEAGVAVNLIEGVKNGSAE